MVRLVAKAASLALFAALAGPVPAWSQAVPGASGVATVTPAAESTPGLPDAPAEGDADDPAFWVHPTDPGRSLVVTAVKDSGLRVYDLNGRLVQRIDAAPAGADGMAGRYNNVDVAYGLALPGGGTMDVAVASDRGRDRIMVWRIDPANPAAPLTDVTAPDQPQVFPTRRATGGGGEVPNPVADQHTAYGLTAWRDPATGVVFAVVAQRNEARLVQHRLVARPDGRVSHERVRHWDFPYSHAGQDLTATSETDPALDWSPQFEGLVVDVERNLLYAGQEDMGLWRVDLASGKADPAPFQVTRGSPKSSFGPGDSRIVRDVEGLAIFHGANGTGYLIASSQGDAHGDERAPDAAGLDDTFAVFERAPPNRYLGSFRIAAAGGIDAVQECDGADIASLPLPGYPGGLLVVQDGYNDDLNGLSGEPKATNFKYVSWSEVAKAMGLTIPVATDDPRKRYFR